jgi:hypothetical protein
MDELKTRSSRPLKILAFYGTKKVTSCGELADYDVVLTTYSIMSEPAYSHSVAAVHACLLCSPLHHACAGRISTYSRSIKGLRCSAGLASG